MITIISVPSEVNSAVKIGDFRCVPPLGTEFLVVAARTEKFPSIETRIEDGYHLLVDQDAEMAAQSFRGLPRGLQLIPEESSEQQLIDPPQSDKHPSFQQSESQLMLTIMAK